MEASPRLRPSRRWKASTNTIITLESSLQAENPTEASTPALIACPKNRTGGIPTLYRRIGVGYDFRTGTKVKHLMSGTGFVYTS